MKHMKLRDKILKYTLKLLNEEGLSNLKVERITDELDISKGNLNYYFPKKDDIIIALFQDYNQKLLDFAEGIKVEDFSINSYRLAVVDLFGIIRKYRGLAFSSAANNYPKDLLSMMKERFEIRNRLVESFWAALYERNLITHVPEKQELRLIIDRLYILSNYWILMYENHYKREMSYRQAIQYFTKVYLQELRAFVTEEGRKELEAVFEA